jgi:hypothetical protein
MRRAWLILPAAGVLAGALVFPRGAWQVPLPLRAHFDSVDAELRAVKTLHLTHGHRTLRGALVGWLGEYREAREFPRNDHFQDRAMPFFRDSRASEAWESSPVGPTSMGVMTRRRSRQQT